MPLLAEHLLKRIAGTALARLEPAAVELLRGTTGRATSASCTTRWSGPT